MSLASAVFLVSLLSLALPVPVHALDLSATQAGSEIAGNDFDTKDFNVKGFNTNDEVDLTSLLLSEPDFLPVEEAYQVTPTLAGKEIYLDWAIAPGYYLYKDKFSVRVEEGGAEGENAEPGESQPWQQTLEPGQPIYDEYYEKDLHVFYGHTRVILSRPAANTISSNSNSILAITSQGCADAGLCYPPRTQYLSVNFDAGSVNELTAFKPNTQGNGLDSLDNLDSSAEPGFTSASELAPAPALAGRPGLGLLLGFALLGGLILNLMPCVFPVLSIKVLGVTAAHLEGHDKHSHGLAYAAGVILSFVAIALVLLALRGAGHVIGWGFQLQSPVFIAALACLFFLMAQGFSGQFTLGVRLMNVGQAATTGSGLGSSFMTGVLATVVASPCTAPFMGTALGVAITQPTGIAVLVFATLGLGMALPFLLLTWIPGLAGKLPAPGPWMETFRQVLAFPLYASVLWLLWVLGRQTDIDHAIIAALGLLSLAFATWLFSRSRKWLGKTLAVALFIAGLALPLLMISGADSSSREASSDGEPSIWEPYTQARLDQLRESKQSVFINLTADWCITCLANEKIALNSARFKAALQDNDIYYLKGDWTNYNAEITRLLGVHGRGGVPLYLFYPAGGEARILPQLLTEKTVLKAIGAAN
ncbi:MAG: protein-disulfide reductase DsbD domain-containing protein [Porticoccaceae bacterium]